MFLIINAALGAGLLNFPKAFDTAGGVLVAVVVQVLELFLDYFRHSKNIFIVSKFNYDTMLVIVDRTFCVARRVIFASFKCFNRLAHAS